MRKIILLLLLFVCTGMQAFSQKTVTGKVTDDKGNPLEGVSVTTLDGKTGTRTDKTGHYSITVANSVKSLMFSAVNYETSSGNINDLGIVNVTMATRVSALEEVVVVGYETRRKKDLTAPVASIKGSEFSERPVGSFANAMQGQLAGVQINSFNGVPGGSVNVKVRGALSIQAGAGGLVSPLYIVDGVQLVSGNTAGLGTSNGFEGTASSTLLNSINPDDIESIDVLKDPATASIYGAQAANGVVIITTKKGRQGKSKINFNTYWGTSRVIKKLEVLDATQAVQLGYEANANRYGPTGANTVSFLNTFGATVTNGQVNPLTNNDWQELAYRQGFVQNYDLSMSGGNDKTTFLMSAGYNDMKGHVQASDFKRGTFRLNLDHKVNEKLSVGNTLTMASYSQNGVYSGGSFGNPARNAFLSFPTNTPYLPDGTLRRTGNGTWFGGIDNFLTYTNNDLNFTNVKSLVGSINLSYKIMRNLTFRSTFSTNFSYTEEKQFLDPRYSAASTNGYVAKFARQVRDFQNNHVLNYNQTFNKKHSVTGLVGWEYRVNKNSSFSASGQGLPLPQFQTLSSTATANSPSEGFADYKLMGFFGKAGYTYDDRYIVNFTARRDGSSRFGKGQQYGFFPAASVAWRLTNEKFIPASFRAKHDIKLRLSAGVTGSQDIIGVYASRNLFGLSGEYAGLSGAAPSQLGNDNLTWEENKTVNAGIDLNLFRRRVSLEVDIYKSERTKMLINVPIPVTNGFSSIAKNVGKAEVKGIDIGLTTVNVNTESFRWTTRFNLGYNKNKITDLGGQPQIGTLYKVGKQLNSIFTYKYAGVNPADGRPMYYDTLGNITYVPQTRDRYYLDGSLDPTYNGGMTNTLSFKGLELRFQFIFQGGNYIQNSDASFTQRAGSTFDRNQVAFQMERWQKPGDITRVPRPYAGGTQPNAASNSFTSDRFFEAGDFARLKEVTLTYSLPKSITGRMHVNAASFYVSGFNLYTWTKYTLYDPEVQGFDFGTYPQAKQTTFGLNVSF